MANVILKEVVKKFGDFVAVQNMNLSIAEGEFTVFVGPSGCGKSTTLRMVAGLESVTGGEIYIKDRLVNRVHPKDRNIAMVFQSYALYPHMNVYDNIGFGLKMRKNPKEEISKRVNEAAEILGIQSLLDRKPRQLSGGQRQRVALGRAIVRKPDVFLFDEPLSNLDAKLRVQMRIELKKLHEQLKTTVIYVTHDQVEAMTMGDRIVVMKDGFVQQVGSPLDLYYKPGNMFVGGFIGSPSMNFLPCRIVQENSEFCVQTSGFKVLLPQEVADHLRKTPETEFVLGIRPEDMREKRSGEEVPPASLIRATVNVVEILGKESLLDLTIRDSNLIAVVGSDVRVKAHQEIDLVINLQKLHLFRKESGEAVA
jgi:multiple sugar transport system ATP-binding protein